MTLHAPAHPSARRLAVRAAAVLVVAAGAVTVPGPAAAAEPARPSAPTAAAAPTRPSALAAPADVDRGRLAVARASRAGARARLAAPARAVAPLVAVAPQVLVTERLPLPFRTLRRADAARYRGTEVVVAAGRAGVLERTYADLGAAGRTLVREEREREPQHRVVAVGTKPRPTYGGLNWSALASCESGGNPRATSRTGKFRGLYQFSLSTWRSVGGTGDPVNHSRASQTAHAYKLYQRDGRAPWPECGRRL